MTEQVAVFRIIVERAEGQTVFLTGAKVARDFDEANKILKDMALLDCPTNYDKTDFTVIYVDGHTYRGCYLLHKRDQTGAHLQDHMRGHLELASERGLIEEKDATQFLNDYSIGG